MPLDIALGAVTFSMAVLGGVVSAHAPTTSKYKLFYGLAFGGLGLLGLVLVVIQSNYNALATLRLSDNLATLNKSSTETLRLQNLNSELQKNLISSSKSLLQLSKENTADMVGGNSFCWLTFEANSGVPLLINEGRHPLYDVSVRVSNTTYFIKQELLGLRNDVSKDRYFSIGQMAAKTGLLQPRITMPMNDLAEQDYALFFSARNGFWDEVVRQRNISGTIERAIRVRWTVKASDNKGYSPQRTVLENISKGYPTEELRKDHHWTDWDKSK